MTVGELIHQQAKEGYIPTAVLSQGLISTMTRTAEESQKLVGILKVPMENMQKLMENVRPHIEAMNTPDGSKDSSALHSLTIRRRR
jgi:hypothetical protein